MKVKIVRPDGTIIEAEGTPEECERLAGTAPAVGPAPLPVSDPPRWLTENPWWLYRPMWMVQPEPTGPSWTSDRIEITCGSGPVSVPYVHVPCDGTGPETTFTYTEPH